MTTTTPLERTDEPAGASSCANLEPSPHNAPNTPTENIGNAHGATLTEGENCVNVQNFSTTHALVEQLIVEPSLDLSLSHSHLLDVSYDKYELCATTSISHASAERNHVMHVASKNNEIQLLSSLHTLGYIEFDDLCNLDCLEERLLAYGDLPWLCRHSSCYWQDYVPLVVIFHTKGSIAGHYLWFLVLNLRAINQLFL
jgi:hypothetical protein